MFMNDDIESRTQYNEINYIQYIIYNTYISNFIYRYKKCMSALIGKYAFLIQILYSLQKSARKKLNIIKIYKISINR